MFWSKVFLQTVLFFSSISSDNATQDMRIKGGEIVPDFGWFSILLNFILILNHHYHLCTYSVDSIKHTVLLKILSLLRVLFSTVYTSIYSIFNRDFLKYQEKKVREKLNVRYV